MVLAWLGAVAAYLAGWLLAARWWYQRIRPWTEPLACHFTSCRHHGMGCYRRWGMVDTRGEAATGAAAIGIIWWALPLYFGAYRLITSGAKPLREETETKTARLEREADQLRRDAR